MKLVKFLSVSFVLILTACATVQTSETEASRQASPNLAVLLNAHNCFSSGICIAEIDGQKQKSRTVSLQPGRHNITVKFPKNTNVYIRVHNQAALQPTLQAGKEYSFFIATLVRDANGKGHRYRARSRFSYLTPGVFGDRYAFFSIREISTGKDIAGYSPMKDGTCDRNGISVPCGVFDGENIDWKRGHLIPNLFGG